MERVGRKGRSDYDYGGEGWTGEGQGAQESTAKAFLKWCILCLDDLTISERQLITSHNSYEFSLDLRTWYISCRIIISSAWFNQPSVSQLDKNTPYIALVSSIGDPNILRKDLLHATFLIAKSYKFKINHFVCKALTWRNTAKGGSKCPRHIL